MARLVAIGDSLTQGFTSGAIERVDKSYPAIIAECMGIGAGDFLVPDFSGRGGLPINIERTSREPWGLIPAYLAEVALYWDFGPGASPTADELYHNLAVWGFRVGDAYQLTADVAAAKARRLIDPELAFRHPLARTAWRVLNPAQTEARGADNQLEIAKRIRERDGSIDHLIVALGANNCLMTVLTMKVVETGDGPPGVWATETLWTEAAFRAEYEALVEGIRGIGAKHVYLATVPHVTIPPLARGMMADGGTELPAGERYFDEYTYFFIEPQDFDANADPHLTKAEAIHIDQTIDAYNRIITAAAAAEGWDVVDLCGLIDDLAWKRNGGQPKRALPGPIADLDIRFFAVDEGGQRTAGGLIGLDGIHPTRAGYGLFAQTFIEVMRKYEPIGDVDFAALLRGDTLLQNPPRALFAIEKFLRLLEHDFHFTRLLG